MNKQNQNSSSSLNESVVAAIPKLASPIQVTILPDVFETNKTNGRYEDLLDNDGRDELGVPMDESDLDDEIYWDSHDPLL